MRLVRRSPRALRLAAAWLLLAALLACGGGDRDSTADDDQTRSPAMRALEANLSEGSTYGEGPDGEALAAGVRRTLAEGDGVAVHVTPGNPRHVTVLVRYRSTGGYEDLRDISVAERNEEIDRIVEAIDNRYGAFDDNLAVAIRGAIFYGALGVRMAGQPMQYHTGSVVSLAPLDPILAAPPGEDRAFPTLVMSEQVEGTIVGRDGSPPTYRIEVTEPGLVVTQLVVDDHAEQPFTVLCEGAHYGMVCADRIIDPLEFQNDGMDDLDERLSRSGRDLEYLAYRLQPGTYTIAVLPNCDLDGPCPTAGGAFTLMATTPR